MCSQDILTWLEELEASNRLKPDHGDNLCGKISWPSRLPESSQQVWKEAEHLWLKWLEAITWVTPEWDQQLERIRGEWRFRNPWRPLELPEVASSPCASDTGSPLCHPQARIRPLVIHSHSLQVSFHMCQVNILNINWCFVLVSFLFAETLCAQNASATLLGSWHPIFVSTCSGTLLFHFFDPFNPSPTSFSSS